MKQYQRTFIFLCFLLTLSIFVGGCSVVKPTLQPVIQFTEDIRSTYSFQQTPTSGSSVSTQAPLETESTRTDLIDGLEDLPFDDFLEDSYHRLMLRDPEYITELGLADAFGIRNDQLTDISDKYLRETQQLESAILELLGSYDRSQLTPDQQISYYVYEWYLGDRVRGHEFMYYDYPITHFITGVQNKLIFFFTDIHPVTDRQDAEDYVTRLSQVNTKFGQLIEGLKLREQAGVISPRFIIQWSLRNISAIASAEAKLTPFYSSFEEKLNALPDLSASDKQVLLQTAEKEINSSVIPAFQALADYLVQLEAVAPMDDGVWQFDNGEAYYNYLLQHHTTTGMTAHEIHELGLQEVARIRAEMRAIFDDLGYPQDESLGELFDRVAEDGGSLQGSELVPAYEAIIEEVKKRMGPFFDLQPKADVIVIGGDSGGFYVAPALDGSRPGAFYANVNGSEPRLSMPSLAYHETIPGHHIQSALAQELDLPTFRKDAFFTGYVEGWALYAEQLAYEMGLYQDDPYGNLGRLQFEIFRAVRLVVDTGIHAKGWTFNQAVEYMRENTGFDSANVSVNVEFEISRYIAWPGQATAYKIGMLKILELRQMAMDRLGDQFEIQEFHNVVLGNGSLPLEILDQVVKETILRN